MRIAVLLDRWHAGGGGLEQYLQSVLPALVQADHGVLLIARGASRGTPLGVSAKDLHKGRFLPRPWADYQEAEEAVAMARCWAADVCWGLRSIPCPGSVWTPMGGSALHLQTARGKKISRRTRALLRMEEQTLADAHLVLPMSPLVSAQMKERAPTKKQVLLPLPLLRAPAAAPKEKDQRPGSLARPLRVVFCGRDPWRHGAAEAVAWFRCLRRAGVHAELDLWSKTQAHSERVLKKKASALLAEGVRLRDWDGQFFASLGQADLLFHPTLYDSFSLVCLEAAAAGVPVVTTESAGVAPMLPAELCATAPRREAEVAAAVSQKLVESWQLLSSARKQALCQQVQAEFAFASHLVKLETLLQQVVAV